jgi:hypothetical protein
VQDFSFTGLFNGAQDRVDPATLAVLRGRARSLGQSLSGPARPDGRRPPRRRDRVNGTGLAAGKKITDGRGEQMLADYARLRITR